MNYKVRNNQTIYDVVNATTGDLNMVYDLVIENNLPGLSDPFPTTEIKFEAPKTVPASVKSSQPSPISESQNYSSRNNQTVYDVCLQVYQDLNLMYKLLQDSNFGNLHSYPVPGTLFNFNPTIRKDPMFSALLKNKNLILSSRTRGITGASYNSSFNNSFDNGE